MKEQNYVVKLLERAKRATREEDAIALKEISDQTLHSTTIYHDEDNALVAVIIYALSKILERGKKYYKENYKKYKKEYILIIDDSIKQLKKGDNKKFREHISQMLSSSNISQDLKQHMKDLFRKAKINKAGKVYEHGISMEKTAKLLGVSQWELAEYTGQSNVSDMKHGETMNVRKRIKLAEDILR
ncbi:MAG: hypothetical protein U9Q06_03985 [Nanoarchaeota archaeon]|nr:hypothetical protein [Nanoarchaeota archaeon]